MTDKKVTRAQFNETYLKDLIALWKKIGRAQTAARRTIKCTVG